MQWQGGGIDKSDTELTDCQRGLVIHKSSWNKDLELILVWNTPPSFAIFLRFFRGGLNPFLWAIYNSYVVFSPREMI